MGLTNKNRIMKFKLYSSIMWMACFIIASCSDQEVIEQVTKPVHSNTLNVVTERQESRSVLNYEGNIFWTENDYIGVYGSETENARFYFTSQADGVSTFTGNMGTSNEAVKWAYFPYSEEIKVNKQQLAFPISAERTISNENHSPMIGRVEANNTVRFYHTGGILYLKVVGLPEYATQMAIISEGDNSPCLAGTAVIDDITAQDCNYRIDNGSREIVYDLQSLNKNEFFHYIYVPLQVGRYEKIRVSIRNEKGGTIKERTLSDLIVERARMTETPVLNFSEKMYGYQLPEDWLVETQWDEAILFSNELFIACDNEGEETKRFFISNVMDWGGKNAKALQVVMDTEGNVLNMTGDTFSAYFSNRKGDYVDITLMLENNIKTFTNQYLPSRSAQGRAGVGEGSISSFLIGIADAFSGLKKTMDPIFSNLGKTELALQGVSAFADNNAVKIVVDIAGETMSGAIEGAVGGLIVGSLGGPAGSVSGAITGAGYGALKGLIVGTIKVIAEELDTKNNERIYEKFCGQAQIVLGEPKQISNEIFSIEYSLSNSQSVPEAYKSRGTCGLLVKEFPNYDILNQSVGQIRFGVLGAQPYGERDLSSDWTHVQNISFKKGYTYLMVAYVTAFDVKDENVLNTLNPICYYSDVKKITFHNSSLENVTIVPNNPMAYADGNFQTTVKADVQCDAKNWKVCILCGENTFMEQSYSGNNSQSVVFNLSIPALYYFNLLKMNDKNDVIEPDAKWRISVVSMNENGSSSSQSDDLYLAYNTPSSIEIVNAKKIETKEISSSSRADAEEGTYYQTTYEITVQVEGAPRFKYFQVRASQGKLYSGNIKPSKDGTYVCQGTIVYKKDEVPDCIDIEGYAFYYGGHFEKFDASIKCIGRPIESCEIK